MRGALRKSAECCLLSVAILAVVGCADGPLNGLLYRKQWQEDEKYGPTLHTRLEELRTTRTQARRLDSSEQVRLARQLVQSVASDASTQYRCEAVRTLGELPTPEVLPGLRQAAQDTEPSVRVAACEAWGTWGDGEAVQVLGELLRKDADLDVRVAAARELARFDNSVAVQALGVALDDPNPALQYRAVESLRECTGEDYGNSVVAWRQYVRGETVVEPPRPTMAERLRKLF
jgi:HEAT repeat protein